MFFFIYSGTTDFNLSAMTLLANSNDGNDDLANTEVKTDDLFKRKRMVGWWPINKVSNKLCLCIQQLMLLKLTPKSYYSFGRVHYIDMIAEQTRARV